MLVTTGNSPSEPTTDQRKLVEHLWSYYRTHGSWPSRKAVIVWADDHDMDLDVEDWAAQQIQVRTDAASFATVRPRFDALLELSDARALLETLPAAARLAAKRFIQQPHFNDGGERSQVDFGELIALWPGEADGRAVLEILRNQSLPFIGYAERTGDREYYSPTLESIRYENVATLDELVLEDLRSANDGGLVTRYQLK